MTTRNCYAAAITVALIALTAACSGMRQPPVAEDHALLAYCGGGLLVSTVSVDENPPRVGLHQSRCGTRRRAVPDRRVAELFGQLEDWRSWELETSSWSDPPGCVVYFRGDKFSFDIDVTKGAALAFVQGLDDLVTETFGPKCMLEATRYLGELQQESE